MYYFPFTLQTWERRSPTQDGGVGLNIAHSDWKNIDQTRPPTKPSGTGSCSQERALLWAPWTPLTRPGRRGLLSGVLKYNSASCKANLWRAYFSRWRESLKAKSGPTLSDTMVHSPPGSSVHGIFQVRILEWVAISFFRGSSRLRDWTQVFHIAGRFFAVWATREAHGERNGDPIWEKVCYKVRGPLAPV